ncbi:MAG: hypothetical protein ACTSU2_15100 [Promethearchaeota archaeon]
MIIVKNKTIEEIVEKYIQAEDYGEELKHVRPLIDYFIEKGPSNFRLHFWKKKGVPFSKKESFIRALFNFLIEQPEDKKLQIIKILRNLYLDSEPEIKEKLLMIFYAALLEKKNFKLSLAALDFFIQTFTFFPEDVKPDVFGNLMDFILNANEDIADEAIFEIVDFSEHLDSKMRGKLIEVLLDVFKKRGNYLKHVAFKELTILYEKFKDNLSDQEKISLFKKIRQLIKISSHTKDGRLIISILRVYIMFQQYFDKDDEKIMLRLLENAVKYRTEIYDKDIVSVLNKFLKTLKFLNLNDMVKKFVGYIHSLYINRNKLDELVNDAIDEFIQNFWEFFPDKYKSKFYS